MSYQGIMLFGKKIPVPECHTPVPECHIPATSQIGSSEIQTNSAIKNACRNNINQTGAENSDESKNSSDLRDTKKESLHNVHENESKANTDEDIVLKKPDKILHCPRCNSLETKFCYFNNYNVNQPRHFCRNCQRYWTAGGTMRNVPIGAGRRKNKHIASQYQHVIVASDGTVAANVEHEHISTLQCNGNVLKFGQDSSHGPLNDSMVNLINHKRSFDHGEEEVSLCGSSVTNGSTQGIELSENNRSKQPLQFSPFHPMMFPMNPNWNNVASMVQSSMNMNMCNNYRTDVAAMPWGLAPKIPIQFFHGSYYHGNGTVSIGSNGCISPSSSTSNSCCSGNGTTTTLGKHTRDSVLIDEEKSEMCVFVPKTLRID